MLDRSTNKKAMRSSTVSKKEGGRGMASGYQDKFPSFDGTNDWFCDKASVHNELEERAQRKAQQKQETAVPVMAAVCKEVRS